MTSPLKDQKKLTAIHLYLTSREKELPLDDLFLTKSGKEVTAEYLFLTQRQKKLTWKELVLTQREKKLTWNELVLTQREKKPRHRFKMDAGMKQQAVPKAITCHCEERSDEVPGSGIPHSIFKIIERGNPLHEAANEGIATWHRGATGDDVKSSAALAPLPGVPFDARRWNK